MSPTCICPECDATVLVKNASAKTVQCLQCGEIFKPVISDEDEAPVRKKKTAPAQQRDDEDDCDSDRKPEKKILRKSRSGDDEAPTRRKKKPATKKSSFPLWLGLSIGGAVVGVAILIIALTSGKKSKSHDVVDNTPPASTTAAGTAPARPKVDVPRSKPKEDANVQPAKEKVPPPEPKDDSDPVPDPNLVVREVNENIEIPPLPPPDKRPILVLDPGGHASSVRKNLFTPDGKQLITVSADKSIRIWDVSTGESIKTILMPNGPGEEGSLTAAALSPEGKKVAVSGIPMEGGAKGVMVYLVSLETYQVEKIFLGHRNIITSLMFSPNGEWLASSALDLRALVTQVKTGQVAVRLEGHSGIVSQVVFHPIDGRLATASHDGTARIWSAPNGKVEFKELRGHNGPVFSVAWNPDGSSLATGGVDGTIRIWSSAGDPLQTIEHDSLAQRDNGKLATTQPFSIAYTKDGKEILYGGVAFTGAVGIVNIAQGKPRLQFIGHSNTVQHVSLSRDSTLAATTGGDENETFIWNTSDGSVVQRIQGAGKTVWAVASTIDGKSILWGNLNRGSAIPARRTLTRSFNLETMEFVKLPERALPAIDNLQPYTIEQPDFYHIKVKVQGQEYYSFRSDSKEERLYSATLLANDRLIVGGSFGLYMVDLKQKKLVRSFIGHTGLIPAVAPYPNGDFFVTGSHDQTIRIWSPSKVDPILSLFFAGREWIAWTPEGYYSASANGERLMGWQMNNGIDKVGTFYPAIQFRQSLFQPDVIKNLFRAKGVLRDAMVLAIRERKKPINAVNLTQVLPPNVLITSPLAVSGDVALKEPTIEVKATATSTGTYPVRALRLLLNGRPYDGQLGLKTIDQPKLGAVQMVWKVEVPVGRHTIHVQAESEVSKGLSAPVDVLQMTGDTRLPNLFVFAVGVNDYPGRLRLNFAATDAMAISKVLQEKTKAVFGKMEIKQLLNKEATKKNILDGLDWLQKSMSAQDVGIFFFSGHGGKDIADNFFLVPVDVGPNLRRTGVSGEIVKRKLSNMKGKVVAIFDACHSGAAAESFQAGQADGLVRDLLTDDCGVVVLCSSLGSESSLESTQTKAGFFTLGLVEGLTGKADFNRDGYVFIHEAAAYAVLRVQQLSGGDQNPTLGRSPNLKPFALTKP